MLDFHVQRCTRRCHETDRELKAGETFFSVLLADGGDVQRYDYGEDSWQGPPEAAIGWWKSQMPAADANRLNWAPNDVMLHYFQRLSQAEDQQDICYILVLLMIRRRMMRVEATETNEQGQEVMVLFCPRNETEYQVVVEIPTAERIVEIQEELAKLLFANAA